MMKNTLFFILIAFNSSVIFSQEKSQVNFLVEVDNGYFEILVDDSIFLKIYKTELLPGNHSAKVWSPGYITASVDFEVREGEKAQVNVPMVVSNQRQEFEREYKAYRTEFHKNLTLPLSVSIGAFITTSTFSLLTYNSKNAVQKNMEQYRMSPNFQDAIKYRDLVEYHNERFLKRRVGLYTSLTLTGLSVATTIFTYTRFKKKYKEPILDAESPFKDKFSFMPTPIGFQFIYKIG